MSDSSGRPGQRIVSCRFASPERAARSSAVSGERRPGRPRAPRRTGPRAPPGRPRRCPRAGPRPGPAGRARGTSRPAASPRRRWSARRRAAGRARRAAAPRRTASPSAGAPGCRRRSSTPPRPRSAGRWGWRRRWPAPATRPRRRRVVDVGDPEVEAVVHGHLERRVRDQVLQPRALAGRVGQPDHASPGSASSARSSTAAEVAARVAEAVLHLEARARSCRPRGPARGRPSAAASRAAPGAVAEAVPERQRAVAAGTISRMRDQVALARQPLERAGRRRSGAGRRRCRGRPCSGGPSRTGRAAGGRPRRRSAGLTGRRSVP